MIKQVLTTILLASATIVPNTTMDNKNITNYPNLIQQTTYDQQGNLTSGTYYQVKECAGTLNLTYATVKLKGFTYMSVNTTNDTYNLFTDFYAKIEYQDGEDNNFQFDKLTINLRGYLNPNTIDQPYYESYYLYGLTTENTYLNTFINEDTYTFINLNIVKNELMTAIDTTNTVESVGTNSTITIDTKYKYLRFRLEWTCDELQDSNTGDINTNLIQNYMNALNNVYSSTTVSYYWTIEVNYTQEVIDIPGLLFTILGMPFAWISTAFDLTLFPGTMYELNVASLFMALIGILILVFIIRKLLK